MGLLGVTIPADDGGAGMDATAATIVHHELSKFDPGTSLVNVICSFLKVFSRNNLFSLTSRILLAYLAHGTLRQ